MLRTIFVFGILIPGIFLAVANRQAALFLYLWYAFFRPDAFLYWDISWLHLSLILGLILLIPSVLTGYLPNLSHPLSIGIAAFMLSGLLAQTNAIDQVTGWVWIDFFVKLTLVCLLTITLVRDQQDFARVVAVVAGSLGFFGSKAGLFSILGGGVRYSEGLAFEWSDNNGFALAMVMCMPLAVAVGQNVEKVLGEWATPQRVRLARLAAYASVPLTGFTAISTFSRAGFLALAASGLVFCFFYARKIRFYVGFIVLGLLAYNYAPLPEGYAERLQSIQRDRNEMDESSRSRLDFWGVALRMVQDEPLGIGMRNFEATYDWYDQTNGMWGRRRSVHSSHFQVLAEQGYLGAVAWVGLFAGSFVYCLAIRRRAAKSPHLEPDQRRFFMTMAAAFMVSMTGFIVGGAFIALALNSLSWITFALVASLDRLSRKMCYPAWRPAATAAAVRT